MDLNLTESELRFRDQLRAWLKDNLPEKPIKAKSDHDPDYWSNLRSWQNKMFEGGWAGVTWPKEFGGRGATSIEAGIYMEEMAALDAPERVGTIGEGLIGPTIMAEGSDEQKEFFLPRILNATDIWCQGFSEPDSGSDVASLATKAVRDGDNFVVNGQKIWTSYAAVADWCLLLVRTDNNVAKHKGISALLVDMKSEGVSVRPLRQMSGESAFNEMFFTNVRVPARNLIGELNDGWRITITTLMNERANLGSSIYILFRKNLTALIKRMKELKSGGMCLSDDPINRQKIAQMYLELEIFKLTTNRALSKIANNATPGPEGSILKIYWSEMNQRLVQSAMEILGDQAQLQDFDDGSWVHGYLRSRGNTIEAGTSEIQRNIIAQRVLGLPRSY